MRLRIQVLSAFACMLLACGGGSKGTSGGTGTTTGSTSNTGSGGSASSSNPYASAAALCAKTINDYRATLGLAPYQHASGNDTCVNGQAKSDAGSGQAHGAFGACGEWAQNECPGWSGPPDQMITDCLKSMWSEGPGGGHYENMRGNYKQVSCGFYVNSQGKVWAVQDFK